MVDRKLREVALPRWHSGRWLLSPDLLRAYDRIYVHPDDAKSIESEAEVSTYNEWEAENLGAMREMREILVIKDHPAHIVPTEREVERIASDLLSLHELSGDERSRTAGLLELKDAVAQGHRWWVDYNESKLKILDPTEPYANKLKELIPNWQSRISRIDNCQLLEFPKLVRTDREVASTYTRLVAATMRMVHGADTGIDVYDHMLPEYLPMITIYERYRLIKKGQWDPKRRFDVIARWVKIRKGASVQFDELETFLQRFRYAEPSTERLKVGLSELDGLLLRMESMPVEAQWIKQWTQRASEVLNRIQRCCNSIRYAAWGMGIFGLLNEGALGKALEIVPIVAEAPRIRGQLVRLISAAYGMPGSSGRYIMIASSSVRSLGGIVRKRRRVREALARERIDEHFLPYMLRSKGELGAEKVVP